MTLEKTFQLRVAAPPEHLLEPEKVFGGRPPFGSLEREGDLLSGHLTAEVPLLSEVKFPFRSRIRPQEGGRAALEALPVEPGPEFWSELSGGGRVEAPGVIEYSLTFRVHAGLPEGEKWGGKALRRMAEAAFERTVDRALGRLEADLKAGAK